jgi:hypothetical protein
LVCLGNPLHPEGPFRDCFAEGTDWITRHIDSRTVPITNKAEFERWIAAYGEDSDFVLARVRGIFPRQAFNRFISPDVVDEAMRRPVESSSDPLVMGVDVARFGDDVARAKRTRTFSTVDRTLKKPRRGDPIVAQGSQKCRCIPVTVWDLGLESSAVRRAPMSAPGQSRGQGVTSMRSIARALAARGIATPRGGDWSNVQVAAILRR